MLERVTLNNNSAATDGGGIFFNNTSSGVLTNITVTANTCGHTAEGHGCGLGGTDSFNLSLNNATIVGNNADAAHNALGGGIYFSGGNGASARLNVQNSIISDNTTPNTAGLTTTAVVLDRPKSVEQSHIGARHRLGRVLRRLQLLRR